MRVLICASGPLGDRLAGPEIRSLEFAKALSQAHDVTLVAQRSNACTRHGLRVLPLSRRLLIREAARHDVVISPCIPPFLLALKQALGFVAIADEYDPHELELVALQGKHHRRDLTLRWLSLATKLRCADRVLCATERQRSNHSEAATRLVCRGAGLKVEPVVLPFGVHEPPPLTGRAPIREAFPQIGDTDTVVLWWGAIWRWLDAETAVRAFAVLAERRPDIKLVFTAGSPPNRGNERFAAVAEARTLAAELGVLDNTVLFLDEWIPYEDRHDYLNDADLGLTLHRFSAEAALAARARYMDYLSAALPCILGRGDETADDFEAAGFATLVDHPSPEELARIISALADNRHALRAARLAGERLAAERSWSAVGDTLRALIETTPRQTGISLRTMVALLRDAGSYYAIKLAARFTTA